MRNQILKILIVSLFFLFLTFPVQAASPLDVVINEIAWMGTEISYADEWIELYNNTDSPINLEGWTLKAADGTPEINLTGTIRANSFYLLERTDDTTIPEISADQIYKGALRNDGENLELYDNFGNLIDSVNCSSGWFAGDNETKQTMERIDSNMTGSDPVNWAKSQNPGGTPKVENSVLSQLVSSEPEPEPSSAETSEDEPEPTGEFVEAEPRQIVYPSGVVINEILPSPEGPDAEEEWIEIFNQNDFEVNLGDWQITDTVGKTRIFTFPEGTKIHQKAFLVLSRKSTKITLNNDGDGLQVLQPNKKIIDEVIYEKAPRGKSYNRTESGWAWSSILTPGSENIIPTPTPKIKETEPSKEPVPEKETGEGPSTIEMAAVSEQISQPPKSLYVFLIALSLAIFSGIIILILRKKLKDTATV